MKKLILLFSVFALVLTSCSSDNDSSSNDRIIGTWKPYKIFVNEIEEGLDECRDMDRLVFLEDGSYEATFYDLDNNDNCIEDTESYLNIEWEKGSNNTYIFTYGDEEPYTEEVFFESNNVFYIIYDDVYEDVNENEITDVYKELFKRVN